MPHVACDIRFHDLIDVSEPVELIATGFDFTEGPIWHPTQHHLTFSDIPGNARYRWSPDGALTEVARPTNMANGMTYDADMNLIVCEHRTATVARISPRGRREILCSHFEGRELNSPNDVVVHSNGTIYFTDPNYGRQERFGIVRPAELGFQAVFMLPHDHRPGAEARLASERDVFNQPNGLTLSPCEKWMWVNDSEEGLIRQYRIAEDGRLTEGAVFASGIEETGRPGVPDGMKCDSAGNIYVTGPGGIWVYDANGGKLGEIGAPEPVANFHWGGMAWDRLFLTANTSIYAVKTKSRPHPEPFMAASA
ncbi:MAG: SMP-30/gluconolactonase/LRE family protein [Pikeienuella sp.]